MKHLVLYYDKYKTIPQVKTFGDQAAADNFISAKTKAGIICYEYNFNAKYEVTRNTIKSAQI